MNFYESMKRNVMVETENGALGYATSGKYLVDLNFAAGSMRDMTDKEIADKFMTSYLVDPINSIRWLFYARDIKNGMGERRTFRVILRHLVMTGAITSSKYRNLYDMIADYGRLDDFINLIDSVNEVQKAQIIEVLAEHLTADILGMKAGRPISLLGKWMPSINTTSAKTKARARVIARTMGISHAQYRKLLRDLREHINVVEAKISRNKWDEVVYEAVPSYANLKYNNAFLRHDGERRAEFLSKVSAGEAEIKAGTLYTYDIVRNYYDSVTWYGANLKAKDETLEALWNNLPKREIKNTLVVADGSGSMTVTVGNSKVRALDVANSLAIYFAEHNKGEFKNKYITFSENPQFVEFGEGASLRDKLQIALSYNEVANTDIQAVFDLILKTAIRNEVPQDELPERILIISDMEFDEATYSWDDSVSKPSKTLFEEIADEYAIAGYKLPRLVFWNTNSRTQAIPVQENDLGVALVSGFSTAVAEMVMSDKTDPYEILLEKLADYERVDTLIED